MNELNVTEIIPKEQHPLIFETFDDLQKGEAFVLINDRDPKPSYCQFFAREERAVFMGIS